MSSGETGEVVFLTTRRITKLYPQVIHSLYAELYWLFKTSEYYKDMEKIDLIKAELLVASVAQKLMVGDTLGARVDNSQLINILKLALIEAEKTEEELQNIFEI